LGDFFYFHFVLAQRGAKVKAVFIPFCLGAKLFSLVNLRPFGRFFLFHFVLTQSGAKVKAVFIPFCLGAKLFSLLNLRPFG